MEVAELVGIVQLVEVVVDLQEVVQVDLQDVEVVVVVMSTCVIHAASEGRHIAVTLQSDRRRRSGS